MNLSKVLVMLVLLGVTTTICAKTGYGPGRQDWGFIDVRTGAHMFYWLYYTTANVTNYTQRPLAIWLQGGPGDSSSGYGNFIELGPQDLYGNYRNWTWVKDMNVLFIDNPVGSGFSYVDDIKYLTSNNTEIALDLVKFMKGFYKKHPQFVNVPLHIFCESYGGKMASEFALELHYAIQRNEVKCNLSSLVLGDPLISPIDSALAWAPLLLNMGVVDQEGYNKIAAAASDILKFVEKGDWGQVTMQTEHTLVVVQRESKGVDVFNILKRTISDAHTSTVVRTNNYETLVYSNLTRNNIVDDRDLKLKKLMLAAVSDALGIPSNIKWGAQRDLLYAALAIDIMKPVVHIVSQLLDNTNLKVGVFSGQLDLICPTAGTVKWIDKMQCNYCDKYVKAPRSGFSVDRILEGYEKSAGNFSMFWVNRAGHMVTVDNPAAMSHILKKFTNYG